MSNQRIFITGGASGLGRALAERYARAGWRVAIGDVNDARLDETTPLLGHGGRSFHCDVTREEELGAVREALERDWGGVDVVVNNAGVAASGAIDETTLDDWRWIVDINLLGVVRGCRVFAPLFRRQQHGHFVNVSSMAGLIHPPLMSAYCATKAAVVALSETVQLELARDQVKVSVVCPAFFRTNLAEGQRAASAHTARMTQKLVGEAKLGAPEIAERIFRGVERGDFHILTHPEGRTAWLLKRALPEKLYFAFMERTTRKMLGRR